MASKEIIRIAHSPDSDDAFMFYGLATGKITSPRFEFEHELGDIESLNEAALAGKYEVTAVSIHAYAYLQERYALLGCGASMGEGYGPIVVSSSRFPKEELSSHTVGVPGHRTSAFLALKLFERNIRYSVIPFDQIIESIQGQQIDAGVLIHEGQLLYEAEGLHKVVDLGEWWTEQTGLPLPLGANVIRRDLGEDKMSEISGLIRQSVEYAMAHRPEALNYAQGYGRGLSSEQADQFVSMYVNERTLDLGEEGRKATQLFLDRGYEARIIPQRVQVEFV